MNSWTARLKRRTASGHSPLAIVAVSFALLLATIWAYGPVLFNFFAGDDFAYLPWLQQAMHDPEVVWRNFHHPWMDSQLTQFYRPFTTMVMAGEYFVWGANGLDFRLTNIVCHLISSVFVALCAFQLKRNIGGNADSDKESAPTIFAIAAGGLFALYPLHSEPVVWIIGRVDGMVTMFYLIAFWCYMRWRQNDSLPHLFAACTSFALSLLCKEMAVVLPPTLVCYELILHPQTSLRARIASTIKKTLPFWLLLAVYFAIRKLALGTFVGGYDNSLLYSDPLDVLRYKWQLGLRMFLVPLNYRLMGTHSLLFKAWVAVLCLSALASAWAFVSNSASRRLFLFVASWLVLSFLPIYKVFWVFDDLRGSRWVYLASAPLCLFLAYGLTTLSKTKRVGLVAQAVLCLFLILAATTLRVNNQAWARAGREANAIVKGLNTFYKETAGDPAVGIVGLPMEIDGAYVCLNALAGMTKRPLLERDIYGCTPLDNSDPLLPFGFLKDSILQSQETLKLIRWQSTSGRFQPVVLSANAEKPDRQWSGKELKTILKPAVGAQRFQWLPDGSLEVLAQQAGKQANYVDVALPSLPCWPIDFVTVHVRKLNAGVPAIADLQFKNDLITAYEPTEHSQAQILDTEQDLVFPLRSLVDWTLGGTCHGLRITIPEGCHLVIDKTSIMSADRLMPKIDFANSGYLNAKGTLHLTNAKEAEIRFDASKIPGAADVQLEVLPRSCFFPDQNMTLLTAHLLLKRNLRATDGICKLKAQDFPAHGLYALRLRALDRNGKPIGVAGDHIFVSVD